MKAISKFMLGLMAIVMMLGMSVSIQSCGGATASALASAYNKNCPIDMGNGATLTKVEADGNTIVFSINVPDEIGVEAVLANSDKAAIASALKSGDPDFAESCATLGVNVKYVYTDSENSGEVLITSDMLK